MNKHWDALFDLTHAVHQDESYSGEYLAQRGIIYVAEKKYNRAIADFTIALKIDANNEAALVWKERAQLLLADREQKEAEEERLKDEEILSAFLAGLPTGFGPSDSSMSGAMPMRQQLPARAKLRQPRARKPSRPSSPSTLSFDDLPPLGDDSASHQPIEEPTDFEVNELDDDAVNQMPAAPRRGSSPEARRLELPPDHSVFRTDPPPETSRSPSTRKTAMPLPVAELSTSSSGEIDLEAESDTVVEDSRVDFEVAPATRPGESAELFVDHPAEGAETAEAHEPHQFGVAGTMIVELEQMRQAEAKAKKVAEEAKRRFEENKLKADKAKKSNKARKLEPEEYEEQRKKRKQKIIIGLGSIFVAYWVFQVAWWLIPRSTMPFKEVSAEKMMADYAKDSGSADGRYADKFMCVTGKIQYVPAPTDRAYFQASGQKEDMKIEIQFEESEYLAQLANKDGVDMRISGKVQRYKPGIGVVMMQCTVLPLTKKAEAFPDPRLPGRG